MNKFDLHIMTERTSAAAKEAYLQADRFDADMMYANTLLRACTNYTVAVVVSLIRGDEPDAD
jgi:hypothetical protein